MNKYSQRRSRLRGLLEGQKGIVVFIGKPPGLFGLNRRRCIKNKSNKIEAGIYSFKL